MVSVIVPVYNVEAYIGECLNSIINQSYKDIEILCIDDCGLDNSVTIVKEFMKIDPRIRLINHKWNKGLGGARNTGIEESTGEYIVFVDSDDVIHPFMIENMYKALVCYDVDSVVCGVKRFAEGKIYSHESTFHYISEVGSRKINIEYDKERIIDIWPSACNKMFKRELIQKYACRFPEKILYEDHLFYYQYFANIDSFYYIDEEYYFYRAERSGSITTTSQGRENEIYKVLESLYSIFREKFAPNKLERVYGRIYFRLLWERQFSLHDMNIWLEYCENARNKLFTLFHYDALRSAVDTHIDKEDPFYKYVFYTGLRRRAYIVKRKMKHNKIAIILYGTYKKIRTLLYS